MTLVDNLISDVDDILKTPWDLRNGLIVPSTDDILLAGGGVQFDGTVLYADLAQSSQLVSRQYLSVVNFNTYKLHIQSQ
jgi:adenylate cyclase